MTVVESAVTVVDALIVVPYVTVKGTTCVSVYLNNSRDINTDLQLNFVTCFWIGFSGLYNVTPT